MRRARSLLLAVAHVPLASFVSSLVIERYDSRHGRCVCVCVWWRCDGVLLTASRGYTVVTTGSVCACLPHEINHSPVCRLLTHVYVHGPSTPFFCAVSNCHTNNLSSDSGPASSRMLRCWNLADYGTFPLYQVLTALLTEAVGWSSALTSLAVVVFQCSGAVHSLCAAAWPELDGKSGARAPWGV